MCIRDRMIMITVLHDKNAWFEPGAGHSFSAAGRLNPTDAAVVDVIHTDGGSACSEVPYSGTVDFYPGADSSSYGTAQPGCHDDMCDHMQVEGQDDKGGT